ncbi:MAG: hypothetical protein CVU12_05170 [Bacteroidetes bacterium HGW-Bacteroidetes-7]|jgi:phospholipid/cholesterol/gamma-HCH transport system substrate-binding protein|nr:MAG: hypothetical protein CVU12_05170 [Bacteroidetes bacterium HGW-Bacteroidetes-7]
MKLKLTREQKIGLFAIITLASIYVVVNYLKGKDLFSSTNTYYTVYNNVEGLNSTGPVYIRGLKVGTVESVDYLQEKDEFIVKLKVKSGYNIPDNSVAEIYSVDLLGTKALRVNIGDSKTYLKDKGSMQSITEEGLVDMLKSQFLPLKDQISDLVATLNSTIENVNGIFDADAKKNIATSLENLSKTLAGTKAIVQNLEKSGPEITQLISNINSLSGELTQSTQKLNYGLDNIGEITDSLKTADLAGTVKSLKELLEQMNNPQGTVGKLLSTDSVHNSIEQLIRDLDILIKNITENPKKYIKISVF